MLCYAVIMQCNAKGCWDGEAVVGEAVVWNASPRTGDAMQRMGDVKRRPGCKWSLIHHGKRNDLMSRTMKGDEGKSRQGGRGRRRARFGG